MAKKDKLIENELLEVSTHSDSKYDKLLSVNKRKKE